MEAAQICSSAASPFSTSMRQPELSPPHMLLQEIPFPQVVVVIVPSTQQLTVRGSAEAEARSVTTVTLDPDT